MFVCSETEAVKLRKITRDTIKKNLSFRRLSHAPLEQVIHTIRRNVVQVG